MVSRLQKAVHGDEDELFGRAGEDLVGDDALVCRGRLGAQRRQAGLLRVPETEAVPQGARLVIGQIEDGPHRQALAV